MKKAVFLLSFGLLPFWVASIYVWRGSIGASADYWNVAPWLMVISLPACAITLGIAIVTMIVHGRTAGEPRDKLHAAAKTFGVLASICALLAGLWYLTLKKRQEHNEDLRERAVALVRTHPAVVQEFGPQFTAGIAGMTTGSDERAKRFEVRVSSDTKRLYAIVDVSGNELSFACLTPIDTGHRSSGKHPCEQ